jgi:hypothetical protein
LSNETAAKSRNLIFERLPKSRNLSRFENRGIGTISKASKPIASFEMFENRISKETKKRGEKGWYRKEGREQGGKYKDT